MTDTRLWCLHHIGPDEVHPAPDFATAQKWADWANERFAEHCDVSRFVVAVWPWSAERHAETLAKSIEDWTIPTDDKPDEAFCSAVWDALKGDHTDLRRQQIILEAHRAGDPPII